MCDIVRLIYIHVSIHCFYKGKVREMKCIYRIEGPFFFSPKVSNHYWRKLSRHELMMKCIFLEFITENLETNQTKTINRRCVHLSRSAFLVKRFRGKKHKAVFVSPNKVHRLSAKTFCLPKIAAV